MQDKLTNFVENFAFRAKNAFFTYDAVKFRLSASKGDGY